MMNDLEINSILDELSGKIKAHTVFYIHERIGFYFYLFFLAKLKEYNLDVHNSVTAAVNKIGLSPELATLVLKYAERPDWFSYEFAEKCSHFSVVNYLARIYFLDYHDVISADKEVCELVFELLELNEDDDCLSLFERPKSVFSCMLENIKIRTSAFSVNEREKIDFLMMKDELRHESRKYVCSSYREMNRELEDSYSKIFAFLPFYQRVQSEEIKISRFPKNSYRGEIDYTEANINYITDCLKKNGRAVVIASNSFFTRNYEKFHVQLINQKYLTAVINLPIGSLRFRQLSTSLLVFDKKKTNEGIKFVDLRSFGVYERFGGLQKNPLGDISKELFRNLLLNETKYSRFVPYEEIVDKNYSLNFAEYRSPDAYWTRKIIAAENIKEYDSGIAAKESEAESKKEYFTLGEEAQIFKSFQDTSDIQFVETPGKTEFLCTYDRYLRISDIVNNRIQNTMQYMNIAERELKKYRLTSRDIVIAKILPLKVAILNSDEDIYPAANFFIIRLNEDSSLRPYYVKGFLESPAGEQLIKERASGGGLLSVSKRVLEDLRIPYMDETEQRIYEQKYKDLDTKISHCEKELLDLRKAQRDLINKEGL